MLITKQELKYLGIWIGKIFTYLILLMSPVIAVQTIEKLSFTSFEEPAPAQVIRETGQKMVIMSLSYENILEDIVLQAEEESEDSIFETQSDDPPHIIGPALFYPNPCRLSEQGNIGYELSEALDMDLRIYDIKGNLIYKDILLANTLGGHREYNRVPINFQSIGLGDLPSSVYFFLLMNNGKVLGKGKFVVMP